ncbi:SCY1 protein kinase [Kwoniella heveanensis BCC8398]|uniref:SCY1 protein kinase n=1 Tax=Kwoniella heveanensis BCC8398 TaxID=1296120 RepID=A0A1B9H4E7_9TREE|nr:SCY1 protein kinase [Kwoniella heveanensis BCC8398]
MNYLKSITTSVLQSTGVTFPFSIGERVPGLDSSSSIWEIREGVKRDDGTLLTLFIYDSTLPPFQPGGKDRKVLMQLARNALKKLRTIRHPDVVKYIDSVETETHIYIAMERVRPLEGVLRDWETGGALAGAGSTKGKGKEEWIGWGVKSVSTALAFLNSPPLSQHHAYLLPSSIFVTPSLEWRLAGFDLLTGREDGSGVLWGLGGIAPGDVGDRSAPEVKKGGWGVLRDTDPAQSDTYMLALLLFSLYNPLAPLPTLTSQPSPSMAGALPKALFPLWKRMLNPNPRTRLATTSFVAEAQSAGFWASNPLVSLVGGLDNFELASESDKLSLLRIIKDAASAGTLPGPFTVNKILPSLLHSLSLPSAPSSAMLPLVLELGKLVPPSDYPKIVLEPVVRLYTSPDRGTRMALLDGLGEYADRMDNKIVQEKVWPNLITGFADTVPVIREATVKAVFPLAPKLSDRILNNDLLRLLAKMQMDTEPSIRTNTCILLGRLAPILGHNTKKKVLVPAFARSLKDPFVHARVAGLMALMASVECFDRDDLAGKVVPNMAFTLVDKEKLVRDQAFKAMSMFMGRITEEVKNMPDTVLSEDKQAVSYGPVTTTSAASSANQAGLVNSATGAAGALAGWAIASLGKQLNTPDLNSTMSAASALQVPSAGGSGALSPSASPRLSSDSLSAFGSTSPSVPGPSISRVKTSGVSGSNMRSSSPLGGSGSSHSGLKLGGQKATPAKSSLADTLAGEWEEDEDTANAWGNDDLMDVNADDDDWSAFESAPVPEIVVPPPQSYYVTPTPKTNGTTTTNTKPAVPVKNVVPSASPKPSPVAAFAQASNNAPAAKSSLIPSSPALPATTANEEWGDVEGGGAGESAKSSPAKAAAASATATQSLAGMSKEEKDKEMARRREERKARIAAMKEQKKGKA